MRKKFRYYALIKDTVNDIVLSRYFEADNLTEAAVMVDECIKQLRKKNADISTEYIGISVFKCNTKSK